MFSRSAITAFAMVSTMAMNIKVGAQITPDTATIKADENKMFDKVEVEAYFPGGNAKWVEFLQKNLNAEVPVKNKAPEGTYTVVVQFVVDKEGNVSDIKALTNHGYGMEEEVIRLLKRSPRWIPAEQSGRIVKAYRKQPITFQVIEEKKKKKKKADD